ncbi:GntP family permease [Flagellimonas sp. GZD32]|uniref:GntP family permease n=1 Tax=Flagellimonas cixiensis TaxID=3228750 RepID=UPI0035C90070
MSILLLALSIALIILMTSKFKIHPFLALLAAALFFGLFSGMPLDLILVSIEEGFGVTLGKIGLIILLGVIIGAFLENSGGAYKMANMVVKVIGKKRVHEAMAIIGYFVSIPVFSDSGFIILTPLNKSLTKKAKLSLAGTGIALILGLLITHVLIPPTPGPIAAAGILDADIGLVMLFGFIVSIPALIAAIIYSKKIAAKTYIEPNPEITPEEIEQKIKDAPSTFKSFLPIVVPILLIVAKSLIEFNVGNEVNNLEWYNVISFIGNPTIALIIGAVLSFLLPKKFDTKLLSASGWVGKALMDASIIVLITGAGGIFGKILQNSEMVSIMADSLAGLSLGIWLPFLLSAAIKTAQGSSTVALITAASIIVPLLPTLGFTTEIDKALLVLAVGAGAMVVPHANDSGFWVVTQLTGMDVKTGYKLYTFGALIVGIVAICSIFILSQFI